MTDIDHTQPDDSVELGEFVRQLDDEEAEAYRPVVETDGPRRFFHYTSVQHLESIERTGLILPTESNIGSPTPELPPSGSRVGPDVVWLMDEYDPFAHDHGLVGSFHNKRAVRIEVDVPAILWLAWEPAMRMNPVWRGAFMHSGGGAPAYHHWYVWPAPIKRGRWVDISFITDRREAGG